MRGRGARIILWTAALVVMRGARLAAQQADVVRGRVTDDSGHAVSGADVVLTRAYDLQTFDTTTDADGRYRMTIANGRQDYLLFVSKPGFKPYQKRIRLIPGDSAIHGDAVLAPAPPQQLQTVQSRAAPVAPHRTPGFGAPLPGADAMYGGGVTANLTPDQMGDLNAIAQLMPGAAGGTMFGLPAGANGVLLDGLTFQGGALPRDADVRTEIASSAYDPSLGGFSGLQVTSTLSGGSLYQTRTGHVTVDAPVLEYNDPVAARLGNRFAQTSVSGGATGGTAFEHLFYNVSGQLTHRLSSASDLLDANSSVLSAAGVSGDSVRKLATLADREGIPVAPRSFASDAIANTGIFLGRFDLPKSLDDPGAKDIWSLLVYGKVSQYQSLGPGVTATPSLGSNANSAILMAQLVHSSYFGPHNTWLNELRSGFTSNANRTSPWTAAPGGQVLVGSTLPDNTGAVSSLTFGGAGTTGSHAHSWTWETTNTTQWYVHGRANTLKLYGNSRFDGYESRSPGANLGTFSYNSLAELAANSPASYTRTLAAPATSGGEWSGVLALGDFWRKSPTFELEGGLRFEGNHFLTTPALNPAVADAFGVRNDAVPNTLHLSPRLGFTWVLGHGQTMRNVGEYGNGTGMFYQGPYGVMRGGVGEWRSILAPSLLAGPGAATGLPGATQTLTCIGSATPAPDWAAYTSSPSAVPSQCAGGSSGVFRDAAPDVQLIDPSYTAGRSWRANLIWEARLPGFRYKLDGTYALNLDGAGIYDLNFVSNPRFVLANEGDRPVYVPASSIVPGTGLVSQVDARAVPDFGHVTANRSDLRGTARQLTVQVTPDFVFSEVASKSAGFWQRLWERMYVSAAYTYADVRTDARGFDGTTAGDPTALQWANGSLTPRHQVQLQFGIRIARYVSLGAFATIQSGLPYTPMVAGDINGDGYANDQAFVFDPARADSAMASQMKSLLAGAPSGARNCLLQQLGRVATRNSCTGPWSMMLNLRLDANKSIPLWGGRRATIGVNLANPLGGLDELLHGPNHLHGWGTNPQPDQTLYYVRGFDPATNAFVYEANPRFGSTRASQSTIRAPFRVTLDVEVDLTQSYDQQMLNRSMALVKRLHDHPLSAVDTLRTRLRANLLDVYSWLFELSDSLLLSPQQVDSLHAEDAIYRQQVDTMITNLAEYIVDLPPDFKMADVMKEQDRVIQAGWNLGRDQHVPIERILSPQQYKALPGYVTTVLNAKGDVHIRYISIF